MTGPNAPADPPILTGSVACAQVCGLRDDTCRISDKTEEAAPEDLAEVLKNKQSKPAPPTSFDIGSEE